MANPLPNEDDLYQKIKSEKINFSGNIWEFFFHRIAEDVTAIIHICQTGLLANNSLKPLEARKILLCTGDVENIINTLTASSYEQMVFLQFKNRIPIHPLVRELFSHQIGNDIYAINLIAGDYADPLSPDPVPREAVEKIIDHCAGIREFLGTFKNAAYGAEGERSGGVKDIYRGLYDSFSDGLVRVDFDGAIQESNKAFQDMFSGSRNQMDLFVKNLVDSGKFSRMKENVLNQERIKTGFSAAFEREYANRDGKIFPVAVSAWLSTEERGRKTGIWLVVRDLSSQFQEQKELLREFWDTRTVIEKVSDGITLSDDKGHFEIFNTKIAELTGYSKEEANQSGDFSSLIYPEINERSKALEGLSEVVYRDGCHEAETSIRTKSGERRILQVTTSCILYKGREMFLSVYHDITARRKAEADLREQEEFTENLIKSAGFPAFVLDKDHKVIIWNKACEMLTGLEASRVVGTQEHWRGFYAFQRPCLADLVIDGKPDQIEKYYSQSSESKFLPGARHAEDWVIMPDGKERYLLVDGAPVYDSAGKLTAVIETIYDETEIRKAEHERDILNTELMRVNDKMKELALKDPHTGLYNYRYLETAIEAEFDRARRQSQPLSVMMIDIDYFKSINDVYGHQFGDLALRMAAIRLHKAVRRYDIVIRYGGEEFVIICPSSGHGETVNLAQRIVDEFSQHPVGNEENTVRLKLSIGIASYPQDSADKGMSLVELADRIMAKVKESGGDRVLSSRDLDVNKAQTLLDSNDLRDIKEKIELMNKRLNRNLLEELFAFARSSGLREHYTLEEMEKVVTLSVNIARAMSLSSYDIEIISQAAVIRDIGKMSLQEDILLKPGRLSEEEFSRARQHPQIGADVLRGVYSLLPVIPAVLNHHERWDGKGYPRGLKKEEIPMWARIVGLTDAYIALVSDRPYRKGYSEEEASRIIAENSGLQFCPSVVEAYLKVASG